MTDEAPLPLSLIAHTAFCERRAWLEAQGERVENLNMERGGHDHQRVDTRKDERQATHRSVEVHISTLGLTGRCDVVRSDSHGLTVVEYKAAPGRRSTNVTAAQRAQLALQGMCLEERGEQVADYAVYFTTSRRDVAVDITAADRDEALDLVRRTRDIVTNSTAPPPLRDDPRCGRCSHYSVCLPDERGEESGPAASPHRVHAQDPHGSVLHLTVPGSRASVKRGRVEVVRAEEHLASVPLERVHALVVHGNVDLSSALVRELLFRRITILWCSYRGRLMGYASTASSPNGLPRHRQHQWSARGSVEIGRELLAAKVGNQATLLRRNGAAPEPTVKELRRIRRELGRCVSTRDALALEGRAAALYFQNLQRLIKPRGEFVVGAWPGRVGRGASDPLNVSLNLVYGLLVADVTRAVMACGLDPHAGFIHSPGRNKPALSLDLMEQFRPVVADSAVLAALNTGSLRESMFTSVLGGCRLRDNGRRALIEAYERRVDQEITHPTYGYRLTWRRAMEVQARMLLGLFDGTQENYRAMRVR